MSTGSSSTPHDEEILNVFRERGADTGLPTGTGVEQLPIQRRATQLRLGDLADEGRLVIEVDGKPKMWRLADREPTEPVRHPKVATAEQWASYASDVASGCILYGTAALGAAGFVMSSHVLGKTDSVALPLFQDAEIVALATVVGSSGRSCAYWRSSGRCFRSGCRVSLTATSTILLALTSELGDDPIERSVATVYQGPLWWK